VSKWEEEDQVFVVLESEELVSKLYCYIHLGEASEMLVDDIDLMNFVQSIQLACPGKHITLIINGMEKYFRYKYILCFALGKMEIKAVHFSLYILGK